MLEWLPQTPHSQWQTVTDQWTHTMICSNASKSAHSAANYHAMKCSTYQLATKVNQCQGNPKMHVKVFDLHLWRLVNQSSLLVNYTGWWNGRTQITLSQLKGNQTDSWLCLMEKEFAQSQSLTEQRSWCQWWIKQASQEASISVNLTHWGAWDSTCRHKAKDISPSNPANHHSQGLFF